MSIRLAGLDLDDAQGLLEHGPTLGAAQPDHAVATDASGDGCRAQGAFFDHRPDGVITDPADEAAAGIDDVLEKLVVGIAAVDHIQPLGL